MKNEQLETLIRELKKTAIQRKVSLWKRIACDLEGPTRNQRIVNLSKISRYANSDETILVPGKVLGLGTLNKKITIAAYKFSKQAADKIRENGSQVISINELVQKNPTGAKVRIIG